MTPFRLLYKREASWTARSTFLSHTMVVTVDAFTLASALQKSTEVLGVQLAGAVELGRSDDWTIQVFQPDGSYKTVVSCDKCQGHGGTLLEECRWCRGVGFVDRAASDLEEVALTFQRTQGSEIRCIGTCQCGTPIEIGMYGISEGTTYVCGGCGRVWDAHRTPAVHLTHQPSTKEA
jgi:hypothetical protein